MDEPPANRESFGSSKNRTPRAQNNALSEKVSVTDFPKLRESTGIPKGVYRFKTHEEADEWTTRMLAKSQK